ncbi:unnamed protein product [Urochloa humidicola]
MSKQKKDHDETNESSPSREGTGSRAARASRAAGAHGDGEDGGTSVASAGASGPARTQGRCPRNSTRAARLDLDSVVLRDLLVLELWHIPPRGFAAGNPAQNGPRSAALVADELRGRSTLTGQLLAGGSASRHGVLGPRVQGQALGSGITPPPATAMVGTAAASSRPTRPCSGLRQHEASGGPDFCSVVSVIPFPSPKSSVSLLKSHAPPTANGKPCL